MRRLKNVVIFFQIIQHWRLFSLLNVDIIISKALSKFPKNVFPSLTSDNQSAHVDERLFRKGGCLIADVLEITDVLNLNGVMFTADIQKAFDSVNHHF